MVEVQGAWPEGFINAQTAPCPSGTSRHSNGGGCAPASTPLSVYVGPYAKVLGGRVDGNARIEDQALIVNGDVSGNAIVGALTTLGVQGNPHHGPAQFNAKDQAKILSTFSPMGWFGNNLTASGSSTYIGDLEAYSSKSSNVHFGLVDDNTQGLNTSSDVTVKPPYRWRE